jgi:hypothetical protein
MVEKNVIKVITNREFSETNKEFIDALEKSGLQKHIPNIHSKKGNRKPEIKGLSFKRQVSKFRNKKGFVYKSL